MSAQLAPAQREEQIDQLAALYAEDTDIRHPFAVHAEAPLRTRAELRRHFAEDSGIKGIERFEPVGFHVHRTDDPEVVIAEFRYEGSAGDRAFSLPCIFVSRVRDGVIVESRDYANDVAFARAFGLLDDIVAALETQERD